MLVDMTGSSWSESYPRDVPCYTLLSIALLFVLQSTLVSFLPLSPFFLTRGTFSSCKFSSCLVSVSFRSVKQMIAYDDSRVSFVSHSQIRLAFELTIVCVGPLIAFSLWAHRLNLRPTDKPLYRCLFRWWILRHS